MKKVAFEQCRNSPRWRLSNGGMITSKGLGVRKHRVCFETSGQSVWGISIGRDGSSGRSEWKDTLGLDYSWPCMSDKENALRV